MTGRILHDKLWRPEPLSEQEQRFAEIASEAGLDVMFSRAYPPDGEDWEPFDTCQILLEQMMDNGNIAAYGVYCGGSDFTEPEWAIERLAPLLQAGLARTVAENQ